MVRLGVITRVGRHRAAMNAASQSMIGRQENRDRNRAARDEVAAPRSQTSLGFSRIASIDHWDPEQLSDAGISEPLEHADL